MITDNDFENALKASNHRRIMNKVSCKYINSISYDDLESEKLIVLWECLKTYDPTRKKNDDLKRDFSAAGHGSSPLWGCGLD